MDYDNNLTCFLKKRIIKTVSIVLLQTFFLYNAGFATIDKPNLSSEESNLVNKISIQDIGIAKDIGSIKNKYIGKDRKLVIHIQDAHCNYEAQQNIAKILTHLIKNYNVNFVAVEGADGIVDTSWFKAFPDTEIREEVADYFMKKGEITGAEYLSIISDYPFTIYGAEDRKHYIQNLNSFLESYPYKDEFQKYYTTVKTALDRLKKFIYTKELMGLDRQVTGHKEKEIKFADYAAYLKKVATSEKIDIREYENFKILTETLRYEKDIDFDVVNKERAVLIDELSKKLPKDKLSELVNKSVDFKLGKIEGNEFYTYLAKFAKDNDIQLSEKYNNLARYIIYSRIYSKIDNEKLFDEIDLLVNAIKEKMFVNDDQRELDRLWTNVNIALGFMNIELTNKEYEYYLAHRDEFAPDKFTGFISNKASNFGLAYEINEAPSELSYIFPKLVDFYETATKRDEIIVKNMFKGMRGKKTDVGVLITGGFHTKGIAKTLEEKDVSYIVVSPTITKEAESPYISVLTGQKTPFEELLIETEKAELQVADKISDICMDRHIKDNRVNEAGKDFYAEIATYIIKTHIRLFPDTPIDNLKRTIITNFKKASKGCPNRAGSRHILQTIEEKFDEIYASLHKESRTKTVGATLSDNVIDEVIKAPTTKKLTIFEDGIIPEKIKNEYSEYADFVGKLKEAIENLDEEVFANILNSKHIKSEKDSSFVNAFTKENLLKTLKPGSGFKIVLVQPEDEVAGIRVPGILMTETGSCFGHYSTKNKSMYIPWALVDMALSKIINSFKTEISEKDALADSIHELVEYTVLNTAFPDKITLEDVEGTEGKAHFIAQLMEMEIAGPSERGLETILGPSSKLDDKLEDIRNEYLRHREEAKKAISVEDTINQAKDKYAKIHGEGKRDAGYKLSIERLGGENKVRAIIDGIPWPIKQQVVLAMAFGKGDVFRFWPKMDASQKEHFLRQLQTIDIVKCEGYFKKLVVDDKEGAPVGAKNIRAPENVKYAKIKNPEYWKARRIGEEAFRQGKVAFLELAGGKGARLGYTHPKILLKASQLQNKSLARMRAERIRVRAEKYGKPIPWIIMTSDDTEEEIKAFFEEHKKIINGVEYFFGQIPTNWVYFINQNSRPLMTNAGDYFVTDKNLQSVMTDSGETRIERRDERKSQYEVVLGGFGHGEARDVVLRDDEPLEWLKKFGVEYVCSLNCDNAFLQNVACFGWHILSGRDIQPGEEHMSIVAIEKTEPTEKVGMAVLVGERHGMIEYNQIPAELTYLSYAYSIDNKRFVIFKDDDASIRLRPVEDGSEDDIARFFKEHFHQESIDGNLENGLMVDGDFLYKDRFDKWIKEHFLTIDQLPDDWSFTYEATDYNQEILREQDTHLWLHVGSINQLIWSLSSFRDKRNPLSFLPVVRAKNKAIDAFMPHTDEWYPMSVPTGQSARVKGNKFEIMAFHGFLGNNVKGAHILVRREENFAPIKNPKWIGVDTLETAQELYINYDRTLLVERGWSIPDSAVVELSPALSNSLQDISQNGEIGENAKLYLSGKNIFIDKGFKLNKDKVLKIRIDNEYSPQIKAKIGQNVRVNADFSITVRGDSELIVDNETIIAKPIDVTLEDGQGIHVKRDGNYVITEIGIKKEPWYIKYADSVDINEPLTFVEAVLTGLAEDGYMPKKPSNQELLRNITKGVINEHLYSHKRDDKGKISPDDYPVILERFKWEALNAYWLSLNAISSEKAHCVFYPPFVEALSRLSEAFKAKIKLNEENITGTIFDHDEILFAIPSGDKRIMREMVGNIRKGGDTKEFGVLGKIIEESGGRISENWGVFDISVPKALRGTTGLPKQLFVGAFEIVRREGVAEPEEAPKGTKRLVGEEFAGLARKLEEIKTPFPIARFTTPELEGITILLPSQFPPDRYRWTPRKEGEQIEFIDNPTIYFVKTSDGSWSTPSGGVPKKPALTRIKTEELVNKALDEYRAKEGIDIEGLENVIRPAATAIEGYLYGQVKSQKIEPKVYDKGMKNIIPNLASWFTDKSKDKATRQGIINAVKDKRWEVIAQAYFDDIAFGTAGVRGRFAFDRDFDKMADAADKGMGLMADILKGPNTFNNEVLKSFTLGVLRWLESKNQKMKKSDLKLFTGYDSRIAGSEFAELIKKIGLAYGVTVYISDEVIPLPEFSCALKKLSGGEGAIGIFISASHNPKLDNGVKLMASDGRQMGAEPAERKEILKEFRTAKVEETERLLKTLSSEILPDRLVFMGGAEKLKGIEYGKHRLIDTHSIHEEAVFKHIKDEEVIKQNASGLNILYCAFYGAGRKATPRMLRNRGFNVEVIQRMHDLNGRFPYFGVKENPDPALPQSWKYAINAYLEDHTREDLIKKDLFLSNDPDADRYGVVIRVSIEEISSFEGAAEAMGIVFKLTEREQEKYGFGGFRVVPPNEANALIAKYDLDRLQQAGEINPRKHTLGRSNVTSVVVKKLAELFSIKEHVVPVGVDQLASLVVRLESEDKVLVGASEESGTYFTSNHIRDKDGFLAGIRLAEIAAHAKSQNKTLNDLLDEISLNPEIGYFATTNTPIEFEVSIPGTARKIRMVRRVHETLMPYVNKNAADRNYTVVAGDKIFSADSQEEFRSGKYDSLFDYPGFPDAGIRFYFNEDKTSFITIRPSGTGPQMRFYVHLNPPIEKGMTKKELAILKKEMYLHAFFVTKTWMEIANRLTDTMDLSTIDIGEEIRKISKENEKQEKEMIESIKQQEEKEGAHIITQKLHTPLYVRGVTGIGMAKRFLQGGYRQDGYGVAEGAAIDGSFALGKEGNQGYFVEGGKEAFLSTVRMMKDFFKRRAERLGKPIRLIIKPGIGGQHTPFQGIAEAFQIIDLEKGVTVGEYELGKNYENSLAEVLKKIGADWDEIAVIPSSKSGSTDETMMVFSDILYILLRQAALKNGNTWGIFADAVFDTIHEVNFIDGKERSGKDLFKGFNLSLVQRKLNERGLEATYGEVKEIFAKVLGNMFFETTDRPEASRLSAFIRNSGLDKELGEDAPGFGTMFDNIGGRWTGDLHMMTFLAYHDLDAEAYWDARYEGIKQVRKGDYYGNMLGNAILDRGVTDIALVVPDELFWFGKSCEQNFNESIWQNGFANLIAIKESKWNSQRHHYADKQGKLIINLSNLDAKAPSNTAYQWPIDVHGSSKQQLAETFAKLFTTFYGMTHTVGNRLIVRALREGGYTAEEVDISDLDTPPTQILQQNLYLRQPYVELGKGLLANRLEELQRAEAENRGSISAEMREIQKKAEMGELEAYIPGLELVEEIGNSEGLLQAVVHIVSKYAEEKRRKFVPFIYLEGERFYNLRDYLIDLGIEWVMQGTGDQHISYQQILAQPQKYLPFIISFVPEIVLNGKPAIGFAKGYLNDISPNMVRDYFAEASYRALIELRREEGGQGLFLRLIDSDENIAMLKDAMEKGAKILAPLDRKIAKIIQKAEDMAIRPETPLEQTENGSKRELLGVVDGKVVEKYTVHMGDTLSQEPLAIGQTAQLFAKKGEISLFHGEQLSIVKEGQIAERAVMEDYTIFGRAASTVYLVYTPHDGEANVFSGFEAMNAPATQARFAEIEERKRKPIMLHVPVTMHANNSFSAEKAVLRAISGSTLDNVVLDMTQYGKKTTRPGTKVTDTLSGLKQVSLDETFEHVFIFYEDDLEAVRDDEDLREHVMNVFSNKIIPIARPKDETKGVAFVREIESAAVTLGLTDREEIEESISAKGGVGMAGSLKRIMGQLVGEEITFDSLLALLGRPTDTTLQIVDRIHTLINKLLISRPIEQYDMDMEVHTRRKVLWSL